MTFVLLVIPSTHGGCTSCSVVTSALVPNAGVRRLRRRSPGSCRRRRGQCVAGAAGRAGAELLLQCPDRRQPVGEAARHVDRTPSGDVASGTRPQHPPSQLSVLHMPAAETCTMHSMATFWRQTLWSSAAKIVVARVWFTSAEQCSGSGCESVASGRQGPRRGGRR